ncbi:MAG: hypothetical protein Fur0037_12630 [Planctomycetota bacterium]
MTWPAFPAAFQLITLGLFLGFLVLGFGQRIPDGVPPKLYAKSNLVNLAIWGIWWPSMIWVAVLFGRLWCSICPLELVSSLGERLGRAASLSRLDLPRWFRDGWFLLLAYAAIQMLVAGVSMHRTPAYTSIFLLVMLLLALLTGVLMRHRAFCRGFCPVGMLLKTYGRGGMLAVRAAHPLDPDDRRRVARSCPSLLNPPRLESGKDCLLCGACVKASEHGRMRILLRPPYDAGDARDREAPWPQTLFVLLVSGFVTYELTTNWDQAQEWFLWVPRTAATWLGLDPHNGWIAGLFKLFVWPLAFWSLLGGLTMASGGARSMGEAWRRLALPLAVVVSAGHMSKGIAKLATWSGYLPGALEEPLAARTARAYAGGSLARPPALLSWPVLSACASLLLLAGMAFALREIRLEGGDGARGRRPAIVLTGTLFLAIALRWGLWT